MTMAVALKNSTGIDTANQEGLLLVALLVSVVVV